MNASLCLRRRNPLYAMLPSLVAQRSERARAGHLEDGFLHAAKWAVGVRDGFARPAVPLDIARVQAEQMRREEGGFVATGARANFDDGVAVVERIVRQQGGLELRLEVGDGRFEPRDFVRRFGHHVWVVNGNELAGFGELVLGLLELGRQLDDRLEATVLSAQVGDFSGVAEGVRVGEQPFDLARPGDCVAQQVAEAQKSALGLLVALPEPLDAAGGIDETLLARVERVALRADVGMNFRDRRAGLEGVAARAHHSGGCVLWMDVGLHDSPAWPGDQIRKQLLNILAKDRKRQADNKLLV